MPKFTSYSTHLVGCQVSLLLHILVVPHLAQGDIFCLYVHTWRETLSCVVIGLISARSREGLSYTYMKQPKFWLRSGNQNCGSHRNRTSFFCSPVFWPLTLNFFITRVFKVWLHYIVSGNILSCTGSKCLFWGKHFQTKSSIILTSFQ